MTGSAGLSARRIGTETAVVGVDPVTLTEGLDWLQRLGEGEDE